MPLVCNLMCSLVIFYVAFLLLLLSLFLIFSCNLTNMSCICNPVFFSVFFESQSDTDRLVGGMCQLPPKKAKYCREKGKKTNNFLMPTAFKRANFVKFGVKNASLATLTQC